MRNRIAAAVVLTLLPLGAVMAEGVTRYPLANGNKFPIARAVEVPAGTTLIFHSGITPSPADPKAPLNSPAYWGDTRTQALSAFANIKASLDDLHLGFGDVIKML